MKYEIMNESEAPAKPSGPLSKRAALVQEIVSSLAPGKVAKIRLEGSETPRGTKASLSRAAKKLGRSIAVWDASGVVYAGLTEDRAPRRRGRPRSGGDA